MWLGEVNHYARQKLKQNLFAYGFLAIPLALLAIFTFYPLLHGVYLSFLDYQLLKNPTVGGPLAFISRFFVNLRFAPYPWLSWLLFGVSGASFFWMLLRRKHNQMSTKQVSIFMIGLIILNLLPLGTVITKSMQEINYCLEDDRVISNELVSNYLSMLHEQYGKDALIVKEPVNKDETRIYVKRTIWVGPQAYSKIIANPQYVEFVKGNTWYLVLIVLSLCTFILLWLLKKQSFYQRKLDLTLKGIAITLVFLIIVISWSRIFHSQNWPFYEALKNSLNYVLVVPPLQIFALLLAVLVNQKIRGINFFRVLYYIPVITGVVIIGYCWKFIYQPNGLLDATLMFLHIKPLAWLGDRRIALYAIMFVTLWRGLGYYMVLYLAGLQDIPLEIIEAARIDGASLWQMITRIYIPMLQKTISICTVLSTMAALRVFEEIYIMSAGSTGSSPMNGTVTLVYMIYDRAFGQFGLQFSYSSALAVILSIFIAIFTILNFRLERRFSE